jgi:NADPH-dependent 2,4-dienoyl-CoA reductase/sulfur reductase-like enzyme
MAVGRAMRRCRAPINVGVGVRPRLGLAEQAGLKIDRGVAVNAFLETSIAGIHALGDIARWPDPHTQENIRVEHWVGTTGPDRRAHMLGQQKVFDAVPFFLSQHYDADQLCRSCRAVGRDRHRDDIAGRDCLLKPRARAA